MMPQSHPLPSAWLKIENNIFKVPPIDRLLSICVAARQWQNHERTDNEWKMTKEKDIMERKKQRSFLNACHFFNCRSFYIIFMIFLPSGYIIWRGWLSWNFMSSSIIPYIHNTYLIRWKEVRRVAGEWGRDEQRRYSTIFMSVVGERAFPENIILIFSI